MSSSATIKKNLSSELASLISGNVDKFPFITNARQEALQEFQRLGLPGPKQEEYRHTPITRELERNFDFSKDSAEPEEFNTENFFIPDLDAHVLVFINGVFNPRHSTPMLQSADLVVSTMAEVLSESPETIARYISQSSDHKQDAYVAWNTAAWTNGLFIKIADNKILDKPVVLYHIIDSRAGQVVTINRNLILVGKNSEVTVVEKFDSLGNANHFTNYVTEAFVSANAGLHFYSLQNDQGRQYQFNHTHIHQENFSRVNCYTFTFSGKFIRNNLILSLDGEGCESHMYGLYLLDGNIIADNHTVADHKKPNSFSNELYKGVLGENAKGVFNGKIFVRPNAQKTNAFQANRNILLSDQAVINTKPQLEIWADDVKCSHGCTSGQLDEEALFYLQTRGLNRETAQAILLNAFAGEILDNVKLTAIKEHLDRVIGERLHKTL